MVSQHVNITTRNATNCSPCQLSDVDPEQDLSQLTVDGDLLCSVCGSPDDEAAMLVCEGCALGWHIYCLSPPLASVPDGVWVCPVCEGSGVTPDTVAARQLRALDLEQQQQQQAGQRRRLFPTATQRRRNERYLRLHGRLIYSRRPVDGEQTPMVGRLLFTGSEFTVRYADGSEETLSNSAVAKRQHWLLPEGTAVPQSLQHPDFDAPSWGAVTAAAVQHEQKAVAPELVDQPGSSGYERTLQADVMVLLRQLDLRSCRVMCELCPGSKTVRRVFEAFGHELVPVYSVTDPLLASADLVVCTDPSRDSLRLVTSELPCLAGGVALTRVSQGLLSQADSSWGGLAAAGTHISFMQASHVGNERFTWLVACTEGRVLRSLLAA